MAVSVTSSQSRSAEVWVRVRAIATRPGSDASSRSRARQPDSFSKWYEPVRCQQSPLGVSPPDERLEAEQPSGGQVDLWLMEAEHLVPTFGERRSEFLGNGKPLEHVETEFLVEVFGAVLAAALGVVHRGVGIPEQCLCIVVCRRPCDPDRQADLDWLTYVQDHRFANDRDETVTESGINRLASRPEFNPSNRLESVRSNHPRGSARVPIDEFLEELIAWAGQVGAGSEHRRVDETFGRVGRIARVRGTRAAAKPAAGSG